MTQTQTTDRAADTRVVAVPMLTPALPATARERAALDELRTIRVAHGYMVTSRRYRPPEDQAGYREATRLVQCKIRKLVAIVRRERRNAAAAFVPEPTPVAPWIDGEGVTHLPNGWTGTACSACGTGYADCTQALLRTWLSCCSSCYTSKTHQQVENS